MARRIASMGLGHGWLLFAGGANGPRIDGMDSARFACPFNPVNMFSLEAPTDTSALRCESEASHHERTSQSGWTLCLTGLDGAVSQERQSIEKSQNVGDHEGRTIGMSQHQRSRRVEAPRVNSDSCREAGDALLNRRTVDGWKVLGEMIEGACWPLGRRDDRRKPLARKLWRWILTASRRESGTISRTVTREFPRPDSHIPRKDRPMMKEHAINQWTGRLKKPDKRPQMRVVYMRHERTA
jgi:hypothetical protein